MASSSTLIFSFISGDFYFMKKKKSGLGPFGNQIVVSFVLFVFVFVFVFVFEKMHAGARCPGRFVFSDKKRG